VLDCEMAPCALAEGSVLSTEVSVLCWIFPYFQVFALQFFNKVFHYQIYKNFKL
jgi:hypothetical protein